MKKTILTFLALFIGLCAFSQTGLIEDFNHGTTNGWGSEADYKLTNDNGALKIVANKLSTWNSFNYTLPTPIDISAHPYVSLKIKTDMDFNLNFAVWSGFNPAIYEYPVKDKYQAIVSADGYATYTFDFRDIPRVDLTNIVMLNFVFNPEGALGCRATVHFDDLRIGDQAHVVPTILKVPDQFHGINRNKVTVPLWGIKDRATGGQPLKITAVSSNTALIPNPTVTYTSGSPSGKLEYTPATNQAGTTKVTLTVSGNAADDNVSYFNVTVEPNQPPKIDQVEAQNLKSGVLTEIPLTGLDDGDAHAVQLFGVSATSSNPSLIPHPTVDYAQGDFAATLKASPIAGQTGTATITVKVKDDGGTVAGGVDETNMQFDVHVYSDVNNPPFMNLLTNISILQDSPLITVPLRGISDGDDNNQAVTITAVSSNTSVIPNPTVVHSPQAATGELRFSPVAGEIGNSTITVTLTDNGGTGSNNGNESVSYSFDVEVRLRPVLGWEDDFNDGVLGPEWPADWDEDLGEDAHRFKEYDGMLEIEIDKTRTNNKWAGFWFKLPTELDLSKDPYISITMKTDKPGTDMLIFLFDAHRTYNTAKTHTFKVTGDFVEYFFDFSDPSYQMGGGGVQLDMSRIEALLFNFDPGGDRPLLKGKFFFDDLRVGDKAHRQNVTPKVTLADIPDFALEKDSPQQTVGLTNITDGGTGTKTINITATSSNQSVVPNPTIGPIVDGKATLSYKPGVGRTGTSTITVTASAQGSTTIVKKFNIYVSELSSNLAKDLTIDLSTEYQEIDGFGTFMGSGATHTDTLISLAKDMGMSMARFGVIDGDIEGVNDNSDPYIINLDGFNPSALSISNMKRLAPFVDKFIISFWSPSSWMKLNMWKNGVEGWSSNNKLNPIYYEEYAEQVAAVIQIVKRDVGKDVYAVSLQNEPQFNQGYPSCQINPDEFRDLIKVVGARLEAEGLGDVQLFWAEALPAQGTVQEYITKVKADAVAAQYADIVAIHNYDRDGVNVGGSGCDLWKDVFNWAQAGEHKYKTWMTELSGHPLTWDGAMTLAGNIFNALDCGNISAWLWWELSRPEGTATEALVKNNTPTSRYYVSKQYYKYIRPGAIRVKATSAGIPAVAFKDDNAETVTIVLLNNTNQPQTVEVKGGGLPSFWESYTTSRSRNFEKGKDVGSNGLILLPPSSVTTLVGGNINPSPKIDQVPDMVINKNAGSQVVELTGINDGEGFDQEITIVATSSNPSLIADPVVNYSNGQSTGTLTYTPSADKTGTATITVTLTDNGDPVAKTTMKFKVTVQAPVGMEDLDEGEMSIYPNPASDFIKITLGATKGSQLQIIDEKGRVTAVREISDSKEFVINVSDYAKGVYMVSVNDESQTISKKFIVK